MRFALSIIETLFLWLSTPSYAAGDNCAAISNDAAKVICHAEARGLPVNATWADITNYDSEISRRQHAEARGLPVNATWADITNYDSKR